MIKRGKSGKKDAALGRKKKARTAGVVKLQEGGEKPKGSWDEKERRRASILGSRTKGQKKKKRTLSQKEDRSKKKVEWGKEKEADAAG